MTGDSSDIPLRRAVVCLTLAAGMGLVATAARRGLAQEPPAPATAPFSTAQAEAHQAAWAGHLKTAVRETNSLGITLILIPPGEFFMGCPPAQLDEVLAWADRVRQYVPGAERQRVETEEQPYHRVVITRPFRLGATEVTIGQFRKFVESAGYVTETERFGGGNSALTRETNPTKAQANWRTPGYRVTDLSPVSQITWNDMAAFCNWLSIREGRQPVYRPDSEQSWVPAVPPGDGYRLPTEAEWEYACRAGTTTHYSFGNDVGQLDDHAWFDRNADHLGAAAVATKRPNPFGLFDMHGNVWELCQDWHAPDWYARSPREDPQGPATGTRRIARGAAWHYFDLHARCAYRNNYAPTGRTGNIGFRVARGL